MMGSSYLTNPAVFLIQVVFGAYIMVVMLRFLLQLFKADFYNPISQFIVKLTAPVLKYLRRIIPGLGGLDLASVVLMWLLKSIELALIVTLAGLPLSPVMALAWAVPELIKLAINVFLFSILIQVIFSWVNPGAYNPVTALISYLTEPIMRPVRKIIPPVGGLDLSPMAAMIGLYLLQMLLLPPIQALTGSPFR
ncbi:MAG: YggT family protein [Gammaproteobacteria bacterium]|nr:YggT family protein [Gammaproteobacteria bacterium]